MNRKPFLVALSELIVTYWPRISPNWRRRWGRLLPTPGNVIFTMLAIATLLWAQTAGAIPLQSVATASSGTIAYQGRLADSAGDPIVADTFPMVFRLYASASVDANPLWTEHWTSTNEVEVSDGLFNVMLGSLEPIPQSVITGNDTLFLGISVGSDDEMTPRMQLGTVPYAAQALTVPDGSISTAQIADGAVTQAKLGNDVNLIPPDNSIVTAKLADGAVTSAKIVDSGIATSDLADRAVSLRKTTILSFRSGYVNISQNGNATFEFTHNLGHTNYTAICTAEDNGNRGRHLKGAMQSNDANRIRYAVVTAGDDGTQTVRAHCVVMPD